jgi:glutamate dehydrogenase
VREALQDLGVNPGATTASVQGFGNVSQYAIELFHQLGGTVVAVACWDQDDQCAYTYYRKSGIELEQLRSITDRFGGIDKAKAKDLGYEQLPGAAWIEQEVDILIPAALENQVNEKTVEQMSSRVRIVAEGANGPTTPAADDILRQRQIHVIPDFLANAGGVTCSYFEQVQSNMNFYWSKQEVLDKLDQTMTAAYAATSDLAKKRQLSMREAAYVIAISRVAMACADRGWV